MQGIYKIRNAITGRYYVGRSEDVQHRWDTHKARLEAGCHQNQHLQQSWNQYGAAAFLFELVEQVDRIELLEREQVWLDVAFADDDPFNILEQADGSDLWDKIQAGLCSYAKRRGRRTKPKNKCVDCEEEIARRSTRCVQCARAKRSEPLEALCLECGKKADVQGIRCEQCHKRYCIALWRVSEGDMREEAARLFNVTLLVR